MSASRRTFLAGLFTLALAPVLAACGSDEGSASDDAAGGTSSAPAEESAFPVTIAHKWGETTIESAPKRVVTVGYTDHDSLLAVGIVPVGVTYWFGDAEGVVFPWALDALGDAELPTVLKDGDGIQVEKIAELAPDLIIGQYAGITEKDYALLSKIAPTVAQSGDYSDYGMPWDEMALNIGTAVGQATAMQAVVDGVKQRLADDKAAHPEFAGQTAIVVTPYDGLFVYGPEDPRSRMLADLGFTFPTAFESSDDEFGSGVSAERTGELDEVGVTVWIDLEADQNVKSVFEQTATSYPEGRWFDIGEDDGDYYVAHSFITPLSIPYLLDRYVPALAAAADGDPATVPERLGA
jgi:iron complex transport system substrate-binding protein